MSQNLTLTLLVRRKTEPPTEEELSLHPPISHAALDQFYGANQPDIDHVEKFASDNGFTVLKSDSQSRRVIVSGDKTELAKAFLSDCGGRITNIFGFNDAPVAKPHFRHSASSDNSVSYTPNQVAKAYKFPIPSNPGEGQTIALIELGGGFVASDLQTYWQQLGLPNVNVTAVGVDGATNAPTGDPNGPDAEVMLDIEVAGAIAPYAKIVVYFGPNTDQGFYDAIAAAVHDKVRKPNVISISWGGPEDTWGGSTLNAYHALLHDAALLGIPVTVASGDNGSSDGETDGENHVDFPCSSSWALACGGTNLQINGSTITLETVWNNGEGGGATGGGTSSHFSKPLYQKNIPVPAPSASQTVNPTGRGVPDVAGNADPNSGYQVIVDGQQTVIGGTSAAAPLIAAMIALLNQSLSKPLGWSNAKFYAHEATFNDIVSGTNGNFNAGPGWDATTGLGSPNGAELLLALK